MLSSCCNQMVKSGWRKSHLSQFIWSVRANAFLSNQYSLGATLRFWRVWKTYRRVQQIQAAPDHPQYVHLCTWPFYKHYCRSLLTRYDRDATSSCWTKKILRQIAIYPCLRSMNVKGSLKSVLNSYESRPNSVSLTFPLSDGKALMPFV